MNGLNLIDNKLLNEADEYIRQHRLIELFEDLATAVAYRQPDNLEDFLIERLSLHKEQGLKPGVFTESEARNVFKLFDLKNSKKIDKERCIKAIQTMANSNHQFQFTEQVDIPAEVDENTFVKLCEKVLGFAKKEI